MKAVVVELRGSKAAVLDHEGIVRILPNREYRVGQVLELTNSEIVPDTASSKVRPFRSFLRRHAAAAAAAAVIVFGTGSGIAAAYYPASIVTLETDTVLEYRLNIFDKVLSVRSKDDKDEKTADLIEHEVRGWEITEAVASTLDYYLEEDTLSSDNSSVNISVKSPSRHAEKIETSLGDRIDKWNSDHMDQHFPEGVSVVWNNNAAVPGGTGNKPVTAPAAESSSMPENHPAGNGGESEAVKPGGGGSMQAGNGGTMQAGNGGSVQAGNGGSMQAGNGGPVQAGNGGSVQAGNGGSVQAGDSGSVQAGNGGSMQAGDGVSMQARDGSSVQAGNGGQVQAGVSGSMQAGDVGKLQSGDGVSVQAGNGGSMQTGNGGQVQTGDGSSVQTGDGSSAKAGSGNSAQPGNTQSEQPDMEIERSKDGEAGVMEIAGGQNLGESGSRMESFSNNAEPAFAGPVTGEGSPNMQKGSPNIPQEQPGANGGGFQ